MTRFTESHLKRLLREGKIRGYTIQNKPTKSIVVKPEPKQVSYIRSQLLCFKEVFKYKVEEEHRFHPTRKWRFDFCIPELKIAIEYEGIQSEKSRHTTLKGYTGDSQKYNEAQRLGWKVLRYTVLNYKSVGIDVKNLIQQQMLSQ